MLRHELLVCLSSDFLSNLGPTAFYQAHEWQSSLAAVRDTLRKEHTICESLCIWFILKVLIELDPVTFVTNGTSSRTYQGALLQYSRKPPCFMGTTAIYISS
jgi:hypothetical protein